MEIAGGCRFAGPVRGPERGTGVTHTVRAPAFLGLRTSDARPPDASAYPDPLPPAPLIPTGNPSLKFIITLAYPKITANLIYRSV
ncbi:MAG: hypothetical protein A2270_06570 [Elusimicrobia bacterium RIFOXYA12_FULL_51_18]|nr:MAG: hypothetical protein A2270_06570 [Elusimicrobia bacterium RIFOXYA12_FULL_51_18]OGS29699.1 MAG: hypothetical protein A2218_03290 [Elusimicrobia bacterium RIFOXYA2_FULL_53_38]